MTVKRFSSLLSGSFVIIFFLLFSVHSSGAFFLRLCASQQSR